MPRKITKGKRPGTCKACGVDGDVYNANGHCAKCWTAKTSEARRKRNARRVWTHCTKCGSELDAPYPNARWCRECLRVRERERWATNAEYRKRSLERQRERRAAWSPERRKLEVDRRAAHNYGLTLDEYRALRERPCAICGRSEWTGKNDQCVDHCHEAGKVRDILCRNCNSAIGLLQDDPDLIRRAAEYVASHK